tara:strand:- start:798 stop:1418 length:621 start_codon:yes stop_codon:yes gene_type:complete
MHSLYDFIIEPIGERYNNTKQIGDKKLIVNTEIFNHQYVNREAKVISIPKLVKTSIKTGDIVLIHHNVFRRWNNMHGEEQNSKNYINDKTYAIKEDQIFAYKRNNKWKPLDGYCFVKPIKSHDKLSTNKEQPLIGIMKYKDNTLIMIEEGDLVGFTPSSEFEFIIDNDRLYRVLTREISIKYEYQGQEEEYNPSWLQSSRRINKSS